MKPFFDRVPVKAEPLVRHLFAHPLLLVFDHIDQNHRTAGTGNAAKAGDRALGVGQKMQHHHAKRRVDAAGTERQIERIALTKLDVIELAFRSNYFGSRKNFWERSMPITFRAKRASSNVRLPVPQPISASVRSRRSNFSMAREVIRSS